MGEAEKEVKDKEERLGDRVAVSVENADVHNTGILCLIRPECHGISRPAEMWK